MANAINSLNFGGNTYTFTLPYGVCSTASDVAEKVVTVPNFSVENGARILVRFDNTNTSQYPTLNVNGSGAIPIALGDMTDFTSNNIHIDANRSYEFVLNITETDSSLRTTWDLLHADVNAPLMVNFTLNSDSKSCTVDKTFAEVYAAAVAGRPVFAAYEGAEQYYLTLCTSRQIEFSSANRKGEVFALILRDDESALFYSKELVSLDGDTMTGALTLSGDPTKDLHAATKQYVDSNSTKMVSAVIPKGRMRGDVDGDGKITKADYDLIMKYLSQQVSFDDMQEWCADANNDGSIASSDGSSVLNYVGGTTSAIPMEDYFGTWTFADGYWTTDVLIEGLESNMTAILHVDGLIEDGMFCQAEIINSFLKIYSKYPPISDVPCTVWYKHGDGTVVLSINTQNPIPSSETIFVAEYDVTSFSDLKIQYEAGKTIVCKYKTSSVTYLLPLSRVIGRNSISCFQFYISGFYDVDYSENYNSIYVDCMDEGWYVTSNCPIGQHASTHAADGTDPITPASIGAATEQYADSRVFTAVYGTTTLEEVKAAYNSGATVLCTRSDNSAKYILTGLSDTTAYFMGMGASSQILYRVYLDTTWHAASFTCASTSHTHSEYAPAYTYGTEDLTAGVSPLASGQLHFVYE